MIGRKNHYGSKSLRGTQVAALFYSLIESAKLARVDSREYLRVRDRGDPGARAGAAASAPPVGALTQTPGRRQAGGAEEIQIHRMLEAIGHRVQRLARTGFAGVDTEGLRPGEWRPISEKELEKLKKNYLNPYRPARGSAHKKGGVHAGADAEGLDGEDGFESRDTEEDEDFGDDD